MYFCKNKHWIKIRNHSTHICASAICYEMDSKTITQQYKFMHISCFNPDPTNVHAGEQILLPNVPQPCLLVCDLNSGSPFFFIKNIYNTINHMELYGCSLTAGPCYLVKTIANCQTDHEDQFQYSSHTINLFWWPPWKIWDVTGHTIMDWRFSTVYAKLWYSFQAVYSRHRDFSCTASNKRTSHNEADHSIRLHDEPKIMFKNEKH